MTDPDASATTGPTEAPTAPPAAAPAPARTAILVVAFDSQLKWASGVRGALEAKGFRCRTVVPTDVRASFSDDQLADYGGPGGVENLSWNALLDQSERADAVVLVVQGSFVARFLHELRDRLDRSGRSGPVTVSGWVGVVLREITAGFLDRSGSDVVAVNSRSDLRTFTDVSRNLGLPTECLVLSGLPLLSGGYSEAPHGGPVRTVMYADQPTMPSGRRDREYVYQRLVDYARMHPDRTVLLKPRHRLGEGTIHRMKFHPEELLDGVETPPNFRIDYTPIVERLPTLDLMLTVSSTAALEAVGAGVRTAFISDLGVREAIGNHIFLASGLLRTFDQLEKDDIGVPEKEWIDDYFLAAGGSPVATLADRVVAILESDAPRPSRLMRETSYFASQHELFAYREALAAAAPPPAPAARFAGLRRRGRLLAQALLPPRTVFARLERLLRRTRTEVAPGAAGADAARAARDAGPED